MLYICSGKFKDNVIYSKIIFEEAKLKQFYKIMDLKNPLLDEKEKSYIEQTISEKHDAKVKKAESKKGKK